jgi:signal transduction histidine kinase
MQRAARLAAGVTSVTAGSVFAIGAIIFIGYSARVDSMQRLFLGQIHMLPITSLAFMMSGISLWLQRHPRMRRRQRLIAQLLGGIVLLIGYLTFLERTLDIDFGIDRLLFLGTLEQLPYRPLGRMATNSTVALSLAGMALLTLDRHLAWGRRPSNWCASLGLGIASIALVGYLYDAQAMYTFDAAAAMASSTAIAFFLLHLGILFARPASNGVSLLLSETAGGLIARRFGLAVLVIPLAIGWVHIVVRRGNFVSRETSAAITMVTMMIILFGIVLRVASLVHYGDLARQAVLDRESKAREEAERANRAKDDFLAVMSHELRTPLNAIMGYGSLLNQGIAGPVNEAQRTQLGRIAGSAKHLLTLIDEILTLSRIAVGQESVARTVVNVARVCDDAATMLEPQAIAKGLQFEVTLPPGELEIETDEGKLRQALVNVLGNAVKFTDHGAVRLRVLLNESADSVEFEIEDTGVGIAPGHLERVFDSFWQVDQARTRRAGGVGLGLHVTRQLVGLLGGEIHVRSTENQGSVFTIRLPGKHAA